METKAIIFDIDGTLVTTDKGYRVNVVSQALQSLKKSNILSDLDGFWFGKYNSQDIENALGIKSQIFWDAFTDYDNLEERMNATVPFDDIYFLDYLVERGIKIGVVSDALPSVVYSNLEKIGLEYFSSIFITNLKEGLPPKPDPTGLLLCLKELGVKPNEAIYVGNSNADVIAGRNAGICDVLIQRGEYPVDTNSSVTIDSLYDLKSFFQKNTHYSTKLEVSI